MKKRTAALWFSGVLGLLPAAAARAQSQSQESSILDQSSAAAARSGANRLGGATITTPPHAWTGVGQKVDTITVDDLKKEHPRNRAVVGPPVPKQAKAIPQPPPPPPEPPSESSE